MWTRVVQERGGESSWYVPISASLYPMDSFDLIQGYSTVIGLSKLRDFCSRGSSNVWKTFATVGWAGDRAAIRRRRPRTWRASESPRRESFETMIENPSIIFKGSKSWKSWCDIHTCSSYIGYEGCIINQCIWMELDNPGHSTEITPNKVGNIRNYRAVFSKLLQSHPLSQRHLSLCVS